MKKHQIVSYNLFFTTVLLTFFNFSNAQKSTALLQKLINQKSTSKIEKIAFLCELSQQLSHIDSIQAYTFANEALDISEGLGLKTKQVIALDNLSKLSGMYNDSPNQIRYADKCFLMASQTDDPEAKAYANYAIALKYRLIEDNERYISNMLKALSYFEKTKTRYFSNLARVKTVFRASFLLV